MELAESPCSSTTSTVAEGVWLRNSMLNAYVKLPTIRLHVDLPPVCDLIIGSDLGFARMQKLMSLSHFLLCQGTKGLSMLQKACTTV